MKMSDKLHAPTALRLDAQWLVDWMGTRATLYVVEKKEIPVIAEKGSLIGEHAATQQ
jgi:hypothetical protein